MCFLVSQPQLFATWTGEGVAIVKEGVAIVKEGVAIVKEGVAIVKEGGAIVNQQDDSATDVQFLIRRI